MYSGGSPYTINRQWGWAGDTSYESAEDTDNPNQADPLWFAMAGHWETIRAVTQGTPYLQVNADRYLPQQPLELLESWQGRIWRSVFSPYFGKVLRTAVGLILRKPVFLEGGDETYWEEWRNDVCRDGVTDLDAFAQSLLTSALAMGHAAVLVDFPDTENVRTLADEQGANLKPYFVQVEAPSIIGFAHDPRENMGKLQQLRMRETHRVRRGRFGTEYVNRVRVLEPGKYEVWEEGQGGTTDWVVVESGTLSVKDIPVAVCYGQKVGVLHSRPPLLELAHQNLDHYRKASDLTQSLHIAAQPILVGKGLDDLNNSNDSTNPIGLSVNNMLLVGPDSDVVYVQPADSAFQAQQLELERLVGEMKSLSIALLATEKNGVEAAKAKALDRIDSNSVLAVVSKSLQQCLQDAINIAAEYAGVEPPEVVIARDFDLARLEGADITAINTIYGSGLIDKETALRLLKEGELLDDEMDVEEIMAASELEQQQSMEQELAMTEGMAEIGAKYEQKPEKPAKGKE